MWKKDRSYLYFLLNLHTSNLPFLVYVLSLTHTTNTLHILLILCICYLSPHPSRMKATWGPGLLSTVFTYCFIPGAQKVPGIQLVLNKYFIEWWLVIGNGTGISGWKPQRFKCCPRLMGSFLLGMLKLSVLAQKVMNTPTLGVLKLVLPELTLSRNSVEVMLIGSWY